MPTGSIKLVLFDFDGTLGNTTAAITDSVNDTLAHFGRKPASFDAIRPFLGIGYPELLMSLFSNVDPASDEFAAIRAEYLCNSAKHSRGVVPYDGVVLLLTGLAERGIRYGVLSNKRESSLIIAVQAAFGDQEELLKGFVSVTGSESGFPRKPDPSSVHHIMQLASVSNDEVLYVGDTDVDVATGRNAGVKTVGCLWGFGSREELLRATYLCNEPLDILQVIRTCSS